jgi:hypothetical protein
MVKAGMVRCVRCGELIEPGTPWDLGSRRRYRAEGLLPGQSIAAVTGRRPSTACGEQAVVAGVVEGFICALLKPSESRL